MKKERMKVLSMVEERVITVEEAARLLESLAKGDAGKHSDEICDLEETLSSFSHSVETFTKDIGDRVSGTYKGMEPALKKATRSVVEKTAHIVDEISKSLQESLKNLSDEKSDCCKCDNESVNEKTADDTCAYDDSAPISNDPVSENTDCTNCEPDEKKE